MGVIFSKVQHFKLRFYNKFRVRIIVGTFLGMYFFFIWRTYFFLGGGAYELLTIVIFNLYKLYGTRILPYITLAHFLKLVVDRQTDRRTDMVTYRAAIAAKSHISQKVKYFVQLWSV